MDNIRHAVSEVTIVSVVLSSPAESFAEVRGEAGSTMEESQQVPRRPRQKMYHIGGVKVSLPVKPYPSQLAMMGQVG